MAWLIPPEVKDRSAWYGPELAKDEDWIERFSEVEIAEVERAFGKLDKKGIDFTSITTAEVPLPTLAPRLQRMLDEVLDGRGFVVIRALPVERWTRRGLPLPSSRLESTSAICECRMLKDISYPQPRSSTRCAGAGLLRVLLEPIETDRRGEVSEGSQMLGSTMPSSGCFWQE